LWLEHVPSDDVSSMYFICSANTSLGVESWRYFVQASYTVRTLSSFGHFFFPRNLDLSLDHWISTVF
jgi:hypothetical protein